MPKIFTSSEKTPTMKVLRIQHVKHGHGPFVSNNPEVEDIASTMQLRPPQEPSRGWTAEDVNHLNDEKNPKKFAFLDEKQMQASIKPEHLARLKELGYEPTWVDASHVWGGDNKQVFYTPAASKTDQQFKQKTKFKEYSPEEIKQYNDSKVLKHLSEKLTDIKSLLSKGMKNGGLGGAGSVTSGALLPNLPNPVKNSKVSNASKVKIPGTAPLSNKNPIKQAAQIKNKDIKDMKMQEAQVALKLKPIVKIESNGQWKLESLEMSNYEGYTDADNVKRKLNNLGEETGIHSMNRVKQYGGSGPSAASTEAKQMRAKSKKNPVKVFSPEEIEQYNKK